ncbi:MAG: hypothetical protein IJ617_03465, partial [Oscillospiraceae bacterium]|nr:hypothetical protein [Oscillospiraceae bacterium]
MTYEKNGLFVEEARLEGFAENFARGLRPDGVCGGRRAAMELRRNLRLLADCRGALEERWKDTQAIPGAVRWLLDNAYLAQREGQLAAAELAAAGGLRSSGGALIVLSACESLVRSGLGQLTEERMRLFLDGFQRELVLERAELSVFAAGLRRALILRLLRLCAALEREDGEGAGAEAERVFGSLRRLSMTDLGPLLEQADYVEQVLRRDPAGVYPLMGESSRAYYRFRLSRASRRAGLPEAKAAQKVLALAQAGEGRRRHVGWWILNEPIGRSPRSRKGGGYIAANLLCTLSLSLLAGFLTRSIPAFLLLLLPVSELVKGALDYLLLRLTRPVHVPRLELKDGLPPEGRTLLVVSTLLTDRDSGPAAARRLEECYHLNRDAGAELRFAALADFPDGAAEEYPDQAEILNAAVEAVETLNRRYGGGFYLLARPRVKNADGRWSGWERKRGALLETMRLLRGQPSAVTIAAGDRAGLDGVAYLLALDADTRPGPGTARELAGAMLHPLNTPEVDPEQGLVSAGYGILAPRIGTALADAGSTDFARCFAPRGGADPYESACSELYMDRWGRGGFAGKGLISIDAYLRCMGERVPENLMLSHDAVEGAFLRAGFAGEVEFTDGWPGRALPYYARLERWVRGDWQNLRWLFRPGRMLPDLERWKLFDSLRRSLVPPATLAALALGLVLPGVGLTVAAAAAGLTLLRELAAALVRELLRRESTGGECYA